jgi:hypothetical protein
MRRVEIPRPGGGKRLLGIPSLTDRVIQHSVPKGVSVEHRLYKLGQYLRGWTAYDGIMQYSWPIPEREDWIRRRVRRCY